MSSAVIVRGMARDVRATQHTRPGELRVTRRGRLVTLTAAIGVATLGVVAQQGSPAESTSVVHHPHLATVVVAPGQTVWDIARSVSGESDPRQMVAEIEALNSLPDAGSVRVGQPLVVPTR